MRAGPSPASWAPSPSGTSARSCCSRPGSAAAPRGPSIATTWAGSTIPPRRCVWPSRPAPQQSSSSRRRTRSTGSWKHSRTTGSPRTPRRGRPSTCFAPSTRASTWTRSSAPSEVPVRLHPLGRGDGALVDDIPGVQRRLRLEQDHVNLVGEREGAVLDPARDDDELARAELSVAVAELHAKATLHDQEQLVFAVVVVPHELAPQLDHLHVHVVDVTHDLR